MTSARNRNLFVAVGITASLGVGAVAATSAMADPPGNNGTVKVHELGTPAGTESNDPKLCVFNFEAFDLDANQTGNITILPQGGDTDTTDSLTLTLTTDANGDGATAYVNDGGALTLDDGHYKATLDNKFGTDPGDKAKTKVFKINCETSTTTTSTTTTSSTSSTTPPETTSTTPPETTSTTPPETTSTTPPETTSTTPPETTSTTPPETTSTTPPETTSTTPPETTSTTPPETTSTTPPLETSSTGTSTMPPPPGSETPPPTGPPVQTDLLKGPGSSNTVLLATGLAGLGVVFGAGYLMRRRLDD